MAKFYLQSGSLRKVIDSPDADSAALWAVHEAMLQVVPLDDEPHFSAQEKLERISKGAMIVLGHRITVSERGFDRDDAHQFDTLDTMLQWQSLLQALARLEKDL